MSDAPDAWRIQNAMTAWQAERARILEEDPDVASDEAVLRTLLGAEEGDVENILARLLRASRHAKAQAEALAAMIEDMTARKARFIFRANNMRATALTVMQTMDWPKKDFPDMTASIRSGSQSADITDPDAVPDIYIENVRKIDRATVLSVLKSGGEVPGATLVIGPASITVRTK